MTASSRSPEPLACEQAGDVLKGPDYAGDLLVLAAQTKDSHVLALAAELSRDATGAARTVEDVCSLEQRGEEIRKDGAACDIGKDLARTGLRLPNEIRRAVQDVRTLSPSAPAELMDAVDSVVDAIGTASAVLIIGYCSDP